MSVRIQLASNYQVVELTYDSWNDVCQEEVASARDLVNSLGAEVVNDGKKPGQKNQVKSQSHSSKTDSREGPTEKQISMLRSFGMREETIAALSKQDAWQAIKNRKDNSYSDDFIR